MKIKPDETVSEHPPEPIGGSLSLSPGQSGKHKKGWRALPNWFLQNTFTSRFLAPPLHHPVAGYLVALIAQCIALVLTAFLTMLFPTFRFPGALFLLGTLLVALGWGALPSIVATFIGGILLIFFLLPPYLSLTLAQIGDGVGIALYFIVGCSIGLFASQIQRAREQAEQLASRLDGILQAIPDPMLLYDVHGRSTPLNRAAQRRDVVLVQDMMLTDALSALNIRSVDGELLTEDNVPLTRALRGESVVGEEICYHAIADQRDHIISVSAAPVRSIDGGVIQGAVVVSRDLTTLRASEERYRAIVQTANEGIWLIDQHGRTVYANERMAEMLGISAAELVGRRLLSFVLPEDEMQCQQYIVNSLEGRAGQFEFRFRRSDGNILYTMAATSPMRDGTDAIVGMLGLYTDITHHKRAEQDLELSEERLRLALRNSSISVYQQDRDLRYTRLYNSVRTESILGKNDADFMRSEEAEHLTLLKRHVLDTGQSIRELVQTTTSDVGERVTELTIEPLRDSGGAIVGIIGTALDLTDRIRAEEERTRLLARALRSENRFQRLFEANLVGLIISNNERIIEANDAFLNMVGYSREDLEAGLVSRGTITPAEYVLQDEQAIKDFAIHGEAAPYEKEYIRKDGSRIPVLIGGTTVEQEPLVWLCFVLDLSERNRLEREARAHAKELEALFEAITDGVIVYDVNGRIVRLNATARMQLGRYALPENLQKSIYERAALVRTLSAKGDRLPAEQVPAIRVLLGETITGNDAVDVRMETFDGEDLWLNMSGTPLRDEQGKITGAISISRDVTERRKLEQRTRTALNALLEMAQVLVQGAADGPEITVNSHVDSVHSEHSQKVVQRLAHLTCKVLDCQRLGFTGIEPETELLHPLAVVGLSPEQEEQWWREQEAQEVRLSDSDPVLVERLRANEVLLIDMTQPPYDQAPNPYGIRQMLAVPMVLNNRLLGFLTLDYGGVDHIYSPEEIALTKAVTRLAALAMERDRLLVEAAQSRANELAALSANQLKDEFIGIAGHELRTPLTSMKINVQLATRQLRRQMAHYNKLEKVAVNGAAEKAQGAEKTDVDYSVKNVRSAQDAEINRGAGDANIGKEIIETMEQQLVFLTRMQKQLELQNRLVQDLLDVSRLERGRLELRLFEFDLVALVREVVVEQQYMTPTRIVKLEHLHPHEEMPVIADRDRIYQVLNNYLSNALKYSDADKPVSVCIEQVPGGQQTRVSVIDQGPGISITQQQHIWERFYRVPGIEVLSGSGVGLGLGLSISRTIVEQHNGRVGVESQEKEGATFWFTLPLERV